jgi:hypothetical protein
MFLLDANKLRKVSKNFSYTGTSGEDSQLPKKVSCSIHYQQEKNPARETSRALNFLRERITSHEETREHESSNQKRMDPSPQSQGRNSSVRNQIDGIDQPR